MSRRERVLQIASRIAELQVELATLRAEFADLVPDDDYGPPAAAQPAGKHEEFLSARMLRVMNSKPDHSFDAPELVSAVGIQHSKIDQVRTVLFRLTKAGRIRKIRMGKYRAMTTAARDTTPSGGLPAPSEDQHAAIGPAAGGSR